MIKTALGAALLLPFAWAQDPGTATLEGSVVSRISGEPLKGVRLALQPEDRNGVAERSSSTNASGTFQFTNVEPGRYLLFADRPGFEPQYFSTAGLSVHQGTLLAIAPGDRQKGLAIKLNPYGAVSGRILNEDGEPIAHASVQVMRNGYVHGRRQLIPAGQAMTNDLGEYRIFDLPAGQYVVHAKATGEALSIDQRPHTYVPSYFPNAEDPRAATSVPLAPGQTQQGIDFRLRQAATFAVQGQIQGADPASRGIMVYLQPRVSAGFTEKNPIPVHAGRFEISAVLPGSYILAADQFGPTGGAASTARVELEVRDQDIRGLALTLTRPGELSGRLQVEEPKAKKSGISDTPDRTVQVTLQRLDDDAAFVSAPADDSGKFNLKGVSPGLYRVMLNHLRAGLYIKSIRAGEVDITDSGLDYSRGILPGEISIVLSANGGTLKGTVKGESGFNPGGVQVLALPATGSIARLRGAVTDQSGRFEMKGLAPGDYRVFAFEDLEQGAAEDPDFMKRFSDRARSVSIRELSTETVEAAAIPAALARSQQ